ncbi:MAG: hypothetical protein LBF92_01560 [Synergistaceae bacterium]|jgi:phosphomevalonate kinase|nr:hypothetical protein [Synergistaceae bacterium]
MATYLIDYENVNRNGLSGIKSLTEKDTVIIFVGNMINDVPVETLMAILNSMALVKVKKMKKTADNYLDFQLATCLGSLVAAGEDKEFYIISNDRDFEAVIDYWRYNKAGVSIERRNTIAPQPPAEAAPAAAANSLKLDNATKKTIRGLVKEEKLSPGHYNSIYNLFMNESELKSLHNGLVRLFEQKRGKHLYDLLKDVFEQHKADAVSR